MPSSVQGSNGSAAIFAVALVLVKGFGLPDNEALPLLSEWNEAHAVPPWSEPDLRHKIADARKSNRADGYLLKEDAPRRPAAITPSRIPTPAPVNDAQRKAEQRARWPRFTRIPAAGVEEIARLRSLPVNAVLTAQSLGYLVQASVRDETGVWPSFIIRDENFAQARRFDGVPWTFRDGSTAKAKTLPGSIGSGFIGKRTLGDESCPVLIVEGCVGLLEGFAAVTLADAMGWSVLAAITAGSRFGHDAELLKMMHGRRARIVMDNDPAGAAAAGKWAAELRAVECSVDAVRLPPPAKDLGALIAQSDTAALTSIFTF